MIEIIKEILLQNGYPGADADTLIIGGDIDSLGLLLTLTELGMRCGHSLELKQIHQFNPDADQIKLSVRTLANYVESLDAH